jgi:transposase
MVMTMQQPVQRNWSLYNMAQCEEKSLFLRIISDAVDALCIETEYKGNGRPPYPLDDILKVCCIKVFNCFSQRRTIPDLEFAKALGYIKEVPHFNSIGNYLNNPMITVHLHALYKILAMPLVPFESYFAIDSTGFSISKKHWIDYRLNPKEIRSFRKLHIVTGTLTGVIASAKVTSPYEHDIAQFPNMLKDSCRYFNVREISADKGYLSKDNATAAEAEGVRPFICPKSNTKLSDGRKWWINDDAWDRMVGLWKDNEKLFMQHYHRRSNVESAFSAMKRKFSPHLRSKNETGQTNEALVKVCCYNASVLINSIFELGAKSDFKVTGRPEGFYDKD